MGVPRGRQSKIDGRSQRHSTKWVTMLAQVAMVLAVVIVVGVGVSAHYRRCPFCRHYNLRRNANQKHDGWCVRCGHRFGRTSTSSNRGCACRILTSAASCLTVLRRYLRTITAYGLKRTRIDLKMMCALRYCLYCGF